MSVNGSPAAGRWSAIEINRGFEMNAAVTRRPVVLCVFDGWGYRPETDDNAIALAATPVFDRLMSSCPTALLETCGTEVGLPGGQMGNSEVGHLNLGAGRIVDPEMHA